VGNPSPNVSQKSSHNFQTTFAAHATSLSKQPGALCPIIREPNPLTPNPSSLKNPVKKRTHKLCTPQNRKEKIMRKHLRYKFWKLYKKSVSPLYLNNGILLSSLRVAPSISTSIGYHSFSTKLSQLMTNDRHAFNLAAKKKYQPAPCKISKSISKKRTLKQIEQVKTSNRKWIDPRRLAKLKTREKTKSSDLFKRHRKPKAKYSSFKNNVKQGRTNVAVSQSSFSSASADIFCRTTGDIGALLQSVMQSFTDQSDRNKFCSFVFSHFLNSPDETDRAAISSFTNLLKLPRTVEVIDALLGIVTLYVSVVNSANVTGAIACLVSYLRGFKFFKLSTHFNTLVRTPSTGMLDSCESQGGTINPTSHCFKSINDFKNRWEYATNNPLFVQLRKLIVACISLQVIDVSNITGNKRLLFEAFFPHAQKSTANCFDLIDAMLSVLSCFGDYMEQCLEKKSFSPFLGASKNLRSLEERFRIVSEQHGYMSTAGFDRKTCPMMPHAYKTELEDLKRDFILFKNCAQRGLPSIYLEKIIEDITRFHTYHVTHFQANLIRISPFCVNCFGASGVGKTNVAHLILKYLASVNPHLKHLDASKIATVNPEEAYHSTVSSDTMAIILDDLANTLPDQRNGNAPSAQLTFFITPNPTQAVRAELEKKGCTPITAEIVMVTTNAQDMGAMTSTIDPISTMRRANVHIEIKIHPNYQKIDGTMDTEKVFNKFRDKLTPDCYVFRVYMGVLNKHRSLSFPTVEHTWKNGTTQLLDNLGWDTLLKYVREKSILHYDLQQRQVRKFETLFTSDCFVCDGCHLPTERCSCPKKVFDKSLLAISQATEEHAPPFEHDGSVNEFALANHRLVDRLQNSPYGFLNALQRHFRGFTPYCYSFFPMGNFELRIFRALIHRKFFSNLLYPFNTVFLIIFLAANFLFRMCLSLSFFSYIFQGFNALIMGTLIFREMCNRFQLHTCIHRHPICPQFVSNTISNIRSNRVKYLGWSVAGISSVLITCNLIKRVRNAYRIQCRSQGSLCPKTEQEVEQRNSEKNVWLRNWSNFVPDSNHNLQTMTTESLTHRVKRGMRRILVTPMGHSNNTPRTGQMLIVRSNIGLLAAHTFAGIKQGKLDFFRMPEDCTNHKLSFYFDLSTIYFIPGTDFAVIHIPNMPPVKSLVDYFPDTLSTAIFRGNLISKSTLDQYQIWSANTLTPHSGCQTTKMVCSKPFYGANYMIHAHNHYNGLCGAAFVTQSQPPSLLGFHLGGFSQKTNKGVLGFITRKQIINAIDKIDNIPFAYVGPDGADIPKKLFDLDLVSNNTVHDHCSANFLSVEDGPANCEVLGQGGHAMKHDTKCVPTIIATDAKELFGITKTWCGPPMRTGYPFNASLQFSARTSNGFPVEHLDYAYKDLLSQYSTFLTKPLLKNIKPLNNVQIISGIDGKRFINRLSASTSMGYPINQPKENFYIYFPDDDPLRKDFSCPTMIQQRFYDEVQRCEERLLNGERINSIFSAQLKDEPVESTKTKVRVFQAAPVVLSMLLRKYLLPIVALLSEHPLDSECAAGITSSNTEWEQLMQHILHFGKNRILAGDYSKYDLRMSSQLTAASYKLLHHVSTLCPHYTSDDRKIMHALYAELIYPIVQMNGDIIQLFGSNPSGHNLTVYTNSICNSLIFRCAFYDIYYSQMQVQKNIKFRKACHLITYGDDAMATVNPYYKSFDFSRVKSTLAKYGIKFTAPDKSDVTDIDYFQLEESEFLKRKSTYIPELGIRVGSLNQDSIFKSLSCVLKSKAVNEFEVAKSNIQNAMGEFFLHGRQVYETSQQKMTVICDRHGFIIKEVERSFDECVDKWFKDHSHDIISYASNHPTYKTRLKKLCPSLFYRLSPMIVTPIIKI